MLKKCSIVAIFAWVLGLTVLFAHDRVSLMSSAGEIVRDVSFGILPTKKTLLSLILSRKSLVVISFLLGCFSHLTPWIDLLGVNLRSRILIVSLLERALYSGLIVLATFLAGMTMHVLPMFIDLQRWTEALYPYYPLMFALFTFAFFIMSIRLFFYDFSCHRENNSARACGFLHLITVSFFLSLALFFSISLIIGREAVQVFSSSFAYTMPVYFAFGLGITLPILSHAIIDGIDCTRLWTLLVHWSQMFAAWLVMGLSFICFRCLCGMIDNCLTVYGLCFTCYMIAFVKFCYKNLESQRNWIIFCIIAVVSFLIIEKNELVSGRYKLKTEFQLSQTSEILR